MNSFRHALQTFKASLSVEELEEFELVTLRDLKIRLQAIQNKQESKKRLRNMRRLNYFLEAVEGHGKTIQVFLNTSDILCFVWGPMSFILQVANNYAEAFHTLLDIYHDIGDNLPLLSQYQTLFSSNPHMVRILEHMFMTIFEFHLEALKYFKQPSWKKIFSHTCKTFRSRFNPIIDQLRQYKSLLEKQASLAQFLEFQAANAKAVAEFQQIRENEQRRRYADVQRWLAAADVRADHSGFASVRRADDDSGQWVLDTDQFQTWVDPKLHGSSRQAMLWVNGMPGAGKTVIASRIIDKLCSDSSSTTIYFYCRHGDEQRNSFLGIAAGLLAQMIRLNANIVDYLYEKVYAKGSVRLSLDEARDVLEVGIKSFSRTSIVIDGLDECNAREQHTVTMWFRDLIEKSPSGLEGSVRCLFLSQEGKITSKRLADLPQLPLRSESHDRDIARFIRGMGEKVQRKYRIDDNVRQNLTDAVEKYSCGMFLYAKLVMENLLVQPNREKLLEESGLHRLPQGIGEAYARIFDTVFSIPTAQQARQLLAILICAKRQLKWNEIQGAVSINLDDGSVDFNDRCWVDGPRDICGSLLNVQADGGLELVHTTARHYILDEKIIDPLFQEYEFACLCIGYLGFLGFDENETDDSINELILDGYYAFMDYAVSNWARHLKLALPNLQTYGGWLRLEELLETFLDTHYGPSSFISTSSPKDHDDLTPLRDFSRFEELVSVYESSLKQMRFFGDRNDEYSKLEVIRAVLRIRTSLENKIMSAENRDAHLSKLERYYGHELFKCPRISCRYFHMGFKCEEERGQHVRQHEVPFRCTYKGCLHSELGFSSEAELRRHLTQLHKESVQRKSRYPITSGTDSQPGLEYFQCTECPRKFKQQYNLRGHVRKHRAEKEAKKMSASHQMNNIPTQNAELASNFLPQASFAGKNLEQLKQSYTSNKVKLQHNYGDQIPQQLQDQMRSLEAKIQSQESQERRQGALPQTLSVQQRMQLLSQIPLNGQTLPQHVSDKLLNLPDPQFRAFYLRNRRHQGDQAPQQYQAQMQTPDTSISAEEVQERQEQARSHFDMSQISHQNLSVNTDEDRISGIPTFLQWVRLVNNGITCLNDRG
jgi:hypothetical protein